MHFGQPLASSTICPTWVKRAKREHLMACAIRQLGTAIKIAGNTLRRASSLAATLLPIWSKRFYASSGKIQLSTNACGYASRPLLATSCIILLNLWRWFRAAFLHSFLADDHPDALHRLCLASARVRFDLCSILPKSIRCVIDFQFFFMRTHQRRIRAFGAFSYSRDFNCGSSAPTHCGATRSIISPL